MFLGLRWGVAESRSRKLPAGKGLLIHRLARGLDEIVPAVNTNYKVGLLCGWG